MTKPKLHNHRFRFNKYFAYFTYKEQIVISLKQGKKK